MSDGAQMGRPLTDLERSLLAVIRQCTLIDDAKGDRTEQLRRGNALVELAQGVVRRIEDSG
jgi:hypothetical protein